MITIGITCHNHQDYIADAIQSALDQTTQAEVIVVDDGSTDNSLNIIKKFPVKWIHQNNKGLPSARNTLIMNMNGEYLLPLDSDDMLLENCVEKIEEAIKNTNADVIAPSFKTFGKESADVILMSNPTIHDFKIANRIGYCSAIKRSVLQEVGGYSPRMFWGYEDYALWIDLLKRGKSIVTIPEKLWLYRTKETSMLTESVKHHEELIGQIMKDNPEVYA